MGYPICAEVCPTNAISVVERAVVQAGDEDEEK
jgi:ferredoxin